MQTSEKRKASRRYYVKNRDTIRKRHAQYRKDHKEEIYQKAQERINRRMEQQGYYRGYADNKQKKCVRCKMDIKRNNVRGMYCILCRKIVKEQRI